MTRAAIAAGLATSLLFASAPVSADARPCFEASSWPEADRLFLKDGYWIGGDGSTSVDLGDGRLLWLFSDTWIDPRGKRKRRGAKLIRNSVAIQDGRNPSTASIEYFWNTTDDGKPTAVFPADEGEWFWPGHGILVGDRVLVFLNRLRSVPDGLGFASAGWSIAVIENPDGRPDQWNLEITDMPGNALGITPGFGAVIQRDGHVYALGTADPDKTHPTYVVRWPLEAASQGDLSDGEWWTGAESGWNSDKALEPQPIFGNGQSGMSILRDEESKRFVVAQTVGFGPADVALRFSPTLTGPWTGPETVYQPPEKDRPNVMIYAARMHPPLQGAAIVMTYDNNSFEFAEHFTNPSIYYPRFVRLNRCATESSGAH